MTNMFADINRLKDGNFAGKWHSFPTTPEALQATLKEIGIDGGRYKNFHIHNYYTDMTDLHSRLDAYADINEFNFLAARLTGLSESERQIIEAVMDSGRHCESMADIINVVENLSRFDVQPAHSPGMYGDFLLEMEKDNTAEVFRKLEQSDNPDERVFAQYVLRLAASVDEEAFGCAVIEQENGVFTKYGYLTESEGFKAVYRGTQDIPAEYRVVAYPEPEPRVRAETSDLAELVYKIHALAGEYMSDAHYNVSALAGEGEHFLMLMSDKNIYLCDMNLAYHRDAAAHDLWVNWPTQPVSAVRAISFGAPLTGANVKNRNHTDKSIKEAAMAKVEIYKLKKTAPPQVREYSAFDYMRDGESPNPLHYVREGAGEMHGTLPLTIPGRLMLEPPKGYHGGNIANGDIAVVNGMPYFMDRESGSKFIEIDFDAAAVKDAIHVRYGWFVDVTGAEAISDNLSYVCEDIGIPCGYLGEPKDTGIYNGRRPFLPGASGENNLSFLHPEFLKGKEARAFASLLSELTESVVWTEIFDYLCEQYPANKQDLEKARELFAPELLLPAELRPLSKVIPADADKSELAYLAAKVSGMDEERRNIFDAVVEAGWHCGSVGEIINLTENLDCFELQSTFVGTEYGEYRLERDWEECVEVIERLEKSEDPAERALGKYITLLNRCVDGETFG